ncbi:MAG TPA: hypothetical protein DIT04_07015 [Dysgonomonas sp.]|nr:hypothetical protein [Dysgonomonas sp.]
MKRQTYNLLKEGFQLLVIILAVVFITLTFSIISKMKSLQAQEALLDEIQTGRMEQYHRSQQKVNFIYY